MLPTFAQVDTLVGQVTNSTSESFAGGVSGNGRFVVFESRGNIATENPRNADLNSEIFLFDYAQRRIFQITDTKSVLNNTSMPAAFSNVRVDIVNTRPVISNDGRWIVFSSNATTSTPAVPDPTNPGSFDGNVFTSPTPTPTPTPSPVPSPSPTPVLGANPLTEDANLELWIYEIPSYVAADLSSGAELPITNLSGGSFVRITNTAPSQLPRSGTPTSGAFIADDNHDASLSDDGNAIAFVSTRDLVLGGNPAPPPNPGEDNDEIFTYIRGTNTISQVTRTPRGSLANPIYNKNPTISGSGNRVVFASTGDNPIIGMTGGSNPESSRNEEIFISDLDTAGAPTGLRKQITVTTPTNPGETVNILDIGKRMSRDGNYIGFDSYAQFPSGTNQPGFALFVYNVTADSITQIGPRSNADSAAQGGDVAHYPSFTVDLESNGVEQPTLVFETRLNIKPDGTIPTNQDDGLNPNAARPTQIYKFLLNTSTGSDAAKFIRLTKFPTPNTFLASAQPITTNSASRLAFNLSLTEVGTGNFDFLSEVYYLYQPNIVTEAEDVNLSFATGASGIPVSPSPVPSPSPTATPTPGPSPTPSPTPVTPAAVHGISPGMLVELVLDPAQTMGPSTAIGSIQRSPNLPFELGGVSMTIGGVSVGLQSITGNRIVFVSPQALSSTVTGTTYPVVINNNGTVIRDSVTIVPARPDIFTDLPEPGPGGRARMFNVTNRVHTTEPFTVTTVKIRGGIRVPSVMRLHATGIANTAAGVIVLRIGNSTLTGRIVTGGVIVAPGVYTVEFTLPPGLNLAGDVPVILTVNVDGTLFTSRLEDTAPRVFIL